MKATRVRQFLLFLWIIFLSFHGFCQQAQIDSLEKYYYYSRDAKRMEICLQLSSLYRNINPLKGLDYAAEGILLAQTLKTPEIEGALLNETGVLYRKMGEFSKALDYHQEALTVFRDVDDSMGIAYCLSNIAVVNLDMGYYELALDYANRSLKIKEELNDKGQIAYTLRIIASVYHASGRYKEALPFYDKSLQFYQELNNSEEQANVLLNKAVLISSLHDDFNPGAITEVFGRAQQVYEQTGNNYGVAAVLFHRGLWEVSRGNHSVAEKYFLRAEENARQLNARLLRLKILHALNQFYNTIGRNDLAYEYLTQYSSLQEEIFSDQEAKKISEVESRLIMQEQQREIAVLETDRNMRNLFILMILFLLLVHIALFIALAKRYRITKRLNEKLQVEVASRRKSEVMLKASEEKYKMLVEDKTRFLSIVSHDLRSPFAGMLGLISLLDSQYDAFDEEKRRSIIGTVLRSSLQINELLEDLLSWASVTSGNSVFAPEKLNISQIFSELVELNTLRAQAKGMKITYTETPVFAFADRNMIRTIVLNLLSNAIKFSYPDSEIVLQAVENVCRQKVTIKVIDFGIGMDQAIVDEVLLCQKNTSRTGTAGEKGTGVGLLLVQELLQKHSSQLVITSSPGNGTELQFELDM
ncbi:MAG: tetratricopeptide repeat-containing sensor histidine kinase [Bacteroidales bacterium]|nr:tetratricopeptide repeat-containing sensor histidine kinase [Bacteroidales bacterium]MDD2322493.1 tetratricopeptide repeat-containing sensor histidine kinase [Bacteroidales bacterium]MDD3962005.1 tetratricopeptide repeat-containing sensor histidine kinase [Bacteroidales bacterium]MDY0285074.1 tetratricopeptide repeat-containing sensor histidine kinase [Bacteroidales bacterium]